MYVSRIRFHPHKLTCYSDGTLITQRLHFAQVPHPYRHVLGWYRIAKELQDAQVGAVCIFDGKSRSLAKQGEVRDLHWSRRIAQYCLLDGT